MLLFSTLLEISDKMTKESFVRLIIEWNQGSTFASNIIPDIKWDGKYNVRYGNDDLWLSIEEYRNKNIIAVRYEKIEDDGVVWDTDYIMNFDSYKLSVRLDRSYAPDALLGNSKFSTPYFITMLDRYGYLKDDGDLPVTREPVYITDKNYSTIADIINETVKYRMPIVYVSKTFNETDPVDVGRLAGRLKGAAHVLVQENTATNDIIRRMCANNNEYNGAIGIYYPNPSMPHRRYLYRTNEGYDAYLMERVVRDVIQYSNSQMIEPLFTWQGVNNALLMDRLIAQRKERLEAEAAKKKAEEETYSLINSLDEEEKRIKQRALAEAQAEADKILDGFDNDLQYLQKQVEDLTKVNEALQYENQGLKAKLDNVNAIPVLYMGDEFEFYQGEIKDLVLLVLSEAAANIDSRTRKSDVIKDIIQSNNYQKITEQHINEVKNLLKGYDRMTGPLRQALENLGFVISEDGKHYKLTYYGDNRYQIIFSKTPSDHRTGKNSSQKLIKMVY